MNRVDRNRNLTRTRFERALRPLPAAAARQRIPVAFAVSVAWHARVSVASLPDTLLQTDRHATRFIPTARIRSITPE